MTESEPPEAARESGVADEARYAAERGAASASPSGRAGTGAELEPLAWSTGRIVLGGIAAWVVALVVTLVVPDLHTGERSWWPWCCVAGILLGFLGYSYVRRGRGNAADAH
ncbi:DUF2530 domain-containing protein [Knoellia koreensis]|uniref:DUF2530 domain-containing protein n=1 Tax=Knoellia koreensis TaxID=2730921 RepID=UPI003211D5A5